MRAEQSVIGSVLIDPTALDKITDVVVPSDFQNPDHVKIWDTVKKLYNDGKPVDPVTVAEANKNLDLRYLVKLRQETPTSANVKAYAETVRKDSVERQLIATGAEIAELAKDPNQTIDAKLDLAQQKLSKLTESKTQLPTLKEILKKEVEDLTRRVDLGGKIVGLSTGLLDLDRILSGLQKSDLIYLAGRPSMGKTTLAMNIAEAVLKNNTPVQVHSMEMSSKQIIQRLICSHATIEFNKYRNGTVEDSDWPRITKAMEWLNTVPLHIDDTGALTINELRTRARRAKRENNIGLLIVDYIQLMSGQGENRTNIVSEISRGLKALAKELNIPVLALSQLSRAVESRPKNDRRPVLSDLRESGSIEQDGDVIIFLYSDEVYNEDTEWQGIAEALIRKQRNGETGKVYITKQLQHCRFKNFIGELPKKEKKVSNGYKYEERY